LRCNRDPAKAGASLKKHKVSFELAAGVFGDPFSITVPDPGLEEERWRTIGNPSPDFPVLLFVVHTWPDDNEEDPVGRIVSARRAEAHERKQYEEG
jgi:uncharacterized DUF497 family protein